MVPGLPCAGGGVPGGGLLAVPDAATGVHQLGQAGARQPHTTRQSGLPPSETHAQ